MLLAFLLVEDVIADPPKPDGDSVSKVETSAIDRAPAAEPSAAQPPPSAEKLVPAAAADRSAFDMFLDRLMRAESAGRDTAANPRSTALGPFQFIKSTFLDVMRRHFAADVAHLSETAILALRTDRGFARRAAEAFSRDNMAFLADKGLRPTFGHLRLAFLLGPSAAAKVMQAAPTKPVSHILDGGVIVANPFMRGMTAGDLVARATRDVSPKSQPAANQQIASAEPAAPAPAPAAPAPAPAAQQEPEAPTRVADAAAEASPPQQPGAAADPAPAPAAEKKEQPAQVAADKLRPAARSTDAQPAKRVAGRQTGGRLVVNVTCNERLATCRRWINNEVIKLLRTRTAVDDTRRGA